MKRRPRRLRRVKEQVPWNWKPSAMEDQQKLGWACYAAKFWAFSQILQLPSVRRGLGRANYTSLKQKRMRRISKHLMSTSNYSFLHRTGFFSRKPTAIIVLGQKYIVRFFPEARCDNSIGPKVHSQFFSRRPASLFRGPKLLYWKSCPKPYLWIF